MSPHRAHDDWLSAPQTALIRAATLRGEAGRRAWAELKPNLDLDRLAGAAIGVLPLLYQNLRALRVDDPVMPRLKGIYQRTWYANQVALRHLVPVLRAFHANGIDAIVLGDAALVVQYYRDAGVRPIGVPSLFVASPQWPSALRSMEDAGWRLKPDSDRAARRDPLEPDVCEFEATDGTGVACILRHSILRDVLPDADGLDEDFRRHAVEITVEGVPTRVLSATDQLFHACIHSASHFGPAATRAADCMSILETGSIDWDRLVENAAKFRVVLPVRETLVYLADALAAPVPSYVLAMLKTMSVTGRETLAHRLGVTPPGTPFGAFRKRLAYYIRLSQHWGYLRTVVRFPAFLRDVWDLERSWQVPIWAVRKGVSRMLLRRKAL